MRLIAATVIRGTLRQASPPRSMPRQCNSDATNSLTAGKKSISLRQEHPTGPEYLREINLLNAVWRTMPAAEFGAPKPGRQRTGRGIWPSPPSLPLTS
jgi:hypothetical protein